MYDVVIIGGSFAGLATAMQLRGHRVLVVDQRAIGSHQTSTCAIPVATMKAVGTERAIQETHHALVMHSGRREIRFPLRDPYATFDYYAFCQAMLAHTDAEVWLAKATHYTDGVVNTTRGPVNARFVVDASGWQSLSQRRTQPARSLQTMGYGVETELPVRPAVGPGLHFYFQKRIVRNGYAWVFPCGGNTRIGVCSFDKGARLGPVLDRFLERFGLQIGSTHGGVMGIGWQEPVDGELFVVGDAAGQCLPLTAEGIRTAIYFGVECGRLLADALSGRITADEARSRYREVAQRQARFHAALLKLQNVVARTPEPLLATAGACFSRPIAFSYIMNKYLTASGWQ